MNAACELVVYGAGGFAREVAWLAEDCSTESNRTRVVAFIDDNELIHGQLVNGIEVVGIEESRRRFPSARIVSGIGNPKTRETLMRKAEDAGFEFQTLVHPRAELSKWVEIGEGAVVCAGNIITTNVVLGRHVQVNLDCTIGHDAILGDYATLAPGVHVSGWVHLGERVYVGTGANIINGTCEEPLVVGNGAIVGAGACVTKSVEPDTLVVGVPARLR